MRKFTLAFSALLGGFALQAQVPVHYGPAAHKMVPGAEVVRAGKHSAAPSYIQLQDAATVPFAKADSWLHQALHMDDRDGFNFLNRSEDALGMAHLRYQQTWQTYPVEGSMYILHLQNNRVVAANGDFFTGLNLNPQPALSETQALNRALLHVNAQRYKWQDAAEEAHLKLEQENPLATYYPHGKLVVAPVQGNTATQDFRLAWRFDIYAQEPLSRQFIYVDAHTGAIIWTVDRIHTADVLGTAVTRYSGTQPMTADSYNGSYRLRESGRGQGIQTYNMQNGSNYGAAVDFTDADNYWNNVNAAQDEVATDAHWGAEMTYDYFMVRHSRNSIDGNGYRLLSYVHYGTNYVNASWDGTRMTYGDGNGTTYRPFTALDVAGHEIGHGLCTFTANLTYANESGALNESFSDIWGACIENYGRPTNWNWKVGEDLTSNGQGLRNMANPNQFGDPDTYTGTNWYTGTADNGGVHTNSGVQNYWFYLLTQGGTGTNDLGSAYNVTGQGIVKASNIAFRNLTVYLTPSSDYMDARFYAIQSATDLYGPCTPEVVATTNAWYAVGVGGVFTYTVTAAFTASPVMACSAPSTVNFQNQSVNGGTYLWDFGDGTTSTAHSPSHVYNALGTYNVKLIAYGGPCGNDTTVVNNYISISTSNACTVTLTPTGPNDLQTACSGSVYDSGGPTGDYGDNTNSTITIAPNGAARVTLTFTAFNMEANYDYLYIYDGPSTTSPLIGAYTGTTLPNGGTINSTGGTLTLRQYTDVGVVAAGFVANWTCQLPTAAPTVNFRASDTLSCSGTIDFTDLSNNGPSSWLWNFGDGFTSTQQHPSHTYATSGTYTVVLTATNSIGSGSLTKTAYVVVNKPAGPAANGASRCGPGTVTLTSSGSGTLSWYNSSTSTTPVGTGTSYTTPVLTNSVVYYVSSETPSASSFMNPVNNSFGTGGQHNNTSVQYLTFDVYSPITLVSVWVNSGAAGNRTINLWDASGNLILDTLINIPSGNSRVTLNWNIPAGGYRIGGSSMNLYRNNAGAAYPYVLGNKVRITGSSAGSAFYYYFYNWEIKGLPCVSERTPVQVNINTLPTATITPGPTAQFCPGGSVTLTAGGGNSYQWSTGSTAGTINVNTVGNYYVIATDGAGCRDTSGTVSVSTYTPVATITPSGPTTFCPGSSVTLDAGPGTNYQWSTGATTQTILVSTAGSYSVTMTDANGCTNVTTAAPTVITITNAPVPTITPSGSTTLCPGTSVDLTATQGTGYLWSTGATTQTIPAGPGTYTVTVTFPGGCSGSSTTTTVTQGSGPSAGISPSATAFCTGGSVALTGTGGGSYQWSSGGASQTEVISTGGTYTVTVTDGNGCTDVASVSITENALPNAQMSPSPSFTVCDGTPVTLSASGGTAYAWSTGDQTSSITVSAGGTYAVTVTDANNCSASTQGTVTVNAAPVAAWTSVQNLLQVDFTDASTGSPTTWAWDFGDGNTSSTQNPTHTYGADGTYTVTLIVTNAAGCSDTLTQTVTVIGTGTAVQFGGGHVGIYPNPFSSQLTIEMVLPQAGNVEVELYDMLGHRIAVLFTGDVPAAGLRRVWQAPAALAQGTYMLRVSQNGQSLVHRVVKAD